MALAGFGLAATGVLTAHVLLWHQFGRVIACEVGARVGLLSGLALATTVIAEALGNAFDSPSLQRVGEFAMPVFRLLVVLTLGTCVVAGSTMGTAISAPSSVSQPRWHTHGTGGLTSACS